MASQSDNFISSTYWSDTTSLAAGIATLKELKEKPVIQKINDIGKKLMDGIAALGSKYGIKVNLAGHGYDFVVSFDYAELSNKVLTLYQQEMMARRVFMSGMVYMCFTHTQADIDKTLQATDEAFAIIAKALANKDIDALLRCPPRNPGLKRMV